jgi:hypothetical protein
VGFAELAKGLDRELLVLGHVRVLLVVNLVSPRVDDPTWTNFHVIRSGRML